MGEDGPMSENTCRARRLASVLVAAVLVPVVTSVATTTMTAAATAGQVPAGSILKVNVPEAFGGKTVVGQLTVDNVVNAGFVTAYGCANGLPTDDDGTITRSDLNFDAKVSPIASNRLLVQADDNGDVCFYTQQPAAMIVDVNGVTFDTGVNSFPNRRTDTRTTATPRVAAAGVLRVNVPEAVGGKTVVGQLTVDQVVNAGFVTAYGCANGPPTAADGSIDRSDLNFDARMSPIASNRLLVQADNNGDVCFYTQQPAAMIVDVNGVSDVGITSFANHRTDTRATAQPQVGKGQVLRLNVPQAVGGKTVIGQLTVDRAVDAGFVTAYGCADGIPKNADGAIDRSDLNFDARAAPIASNRLIVAADQNGDVCFYTQEPAAMIVDINAVTTVGISSFPNRRTDTRSPDLPAGSVTTAGVPVYPPYTPLPALNGIAALTGLPADSTVTARPILAVKIDNYGQARPQWALDQADAVIEENVEGVSRFVALFHSQIPDIVGPVRSARTADLDILSAMNRPVFAYSGANDGVNDWIRSAAGSGVLVDFSAQHSGCYSRSPDRPGPHNLLLDPNCAVSRSPSAGPAQPLWTISSTWTVPAEPAVHADTSFTLEMDGVHVGWVWDGASGKYLRSQDGQPHLAVDGAQISADNVVEIGTTYIPSPVDARSPNAITVGTGNAVLHRNGIAVPVVWTRATAYDPYTFTEATTGAPIPLDTGNTFLELERQG
ncbi:MAG: hypothetical protein JWM34_187 [Ilumatobacteraceae bacterium]|nr:hypothetical protein [Ilumatobacteraceae bacterium]